MLNEKKIPGINWRMAAVFFIIAFCARVLFYFYLRKIHPGWNFHALEVNHWLEIARNVVSGAGFSDKALLTYFPTETLHPTAARSPLPVLAVSLLLSLFGGHVLTLLVYSWILSGLSAALIYIFGKKIGNSEKPAVIAALIFCFYLPEMHHSITYAAASEGLFTFLLLLYSFFVFSFRGKDSPLSSLSLGILLGLAFLCRPVVLFFPFLHAAWLFAQYRAKAVTRVLLFFAGFALAAAPWAARNQAVFGKPVFTTTLGGYNLLRHNWMIEKNQFKLCTAEDFRPFADQVIAEAGLDLEKANEVELDGVFKKKAGEIIREYPLRYLKFCVIRLGWLWYKIGAEKPVYLIQNLLLYLFMFPGIALALFRRGGLRFMAFTVLYFVFIYAGINAQFRFIVPVIPLGILLAAENARLFFKKSG